MDDPKLQLRLLDEKLSTTDRANAAEAALSTSLRLMQEALNNITIGPDNRLILPKGPMSQLEALHSNVELKLLTEKEESNKLAKSRNDIKLAMNNIVRLPTPPTYGTGAKESLGLTDLRIIADHSRPLRERLQTLTTFGEGKDFNESNYRTALGAILNREEMDLVQLLPTELPFDLVFQRLASAMIPKTSATKDLEEKLAQFRRKSGESFPNCTARLNVILDALAQISTKFAKSETKNHYLSLAAMHLITEKTDALLQAKVARFKASGKYLEASELELLVTELEEFETAPPAKEIQLFPVDRSQRAVALPVAATPGLISHGDYARKHREYARPDNNPDSSDSSSSDSD